MFGTTGVQGLQQLGIEQPTAGVGVDLDQARAIGAEMEVVTEEDAGSLGRIARDGGCVFQHALMPRPAARQHRSMVPIRSAMNCKCASATYTRVSENRLGRVASNSACEMPMSLLSNT